MNAREYMAKHGLDGDKDKEEDKPQSLGKNMPGHVHVSRAVTAPAVARHMTGRTRERYHEQLAAESESLAQKVNRDLPGQVAGLDR